MFLASLSSYFSTEIDIKLGKEKINKQIRNYLKKYPVSDYSFSARLQLIYVYCYLGQIEKARWVLDDVVLKLLDKTEARKYYFLNGYVLAKEGNITSSIKELSKVSPYKKDFLYQYSLYYQAIFLFKNKEYTKSRTIFKKLQQLKLFVNNIPQYIVETLYQDKKLDSLSSLSALFLKDIRNENYKFILHKKAEVDYSLKKYKNVISDYENYFKEKYIDRNYLFYVSNSYFRLGQFDKSIDNMKKVIDTSNDYTNKVAYYILGHSYIKEKNKNYANICFNECSYIQPKDSLNEICHYNAVKLIYEMSNTSFIGPIKVIKSFLEKYPNSKYKNDIYRLLANSYLVSNNYNEAIEYIEKIESFRENKKLSNIYKEINFFMGIDMYLANKKELAKKYFLKSEKILPYNNLNFISKYFLNKIEYENGSYLSLISKINLNENREFIDYPEYLKNIYLLAYSYYKLENFENAYQNFYLITTLRKKYLDSDSKEIIYDSFSKLGDISFLNRNFKEAIIFYKKSIQLSPNKEEYLYYNLAKSYGLDNRNKDKLNLLNKAITLFKKSPIIAELKNEKAETQLALNLNNKALETYNDIIVNNDKSKYLPIAILQSANITYNNNKPEEAIRYYKSILDRKIEGEHKQIAINRIKQIYIEQGNSEGLLQISSEFNLSKEDSSSIDSTLYQLANYQFLEKKWNRAAIEFKKYLEMFPNGINKTKANYNYAISNLKIGNQEEAIATFKKIVKNSQYSVFYENSLVKLNDYYIEKDDTSNIYKYSSILKKEVENEELKKYAIYHYVKSSFLLKKYDEITSLANEYFKDNFDLFEKKKKYEISLILSKTLILQEKPDYKKAQKLFKKIVNSTKSEYGAEAKYNIAKIYYINNEYNKATKTIFELNNEYYSYEFWVAKGFILLGDSYVKLGDTFQAEHTYKSIVENYSGLDLKNIAKNKLDSLISTK